MISMFLEIELKLSIDPEHVTLLYSHPLLTQLSQEQGPASTEQLISRYFDTACLCLWQQAFHYAFEKLEVALYKP
jgi:inorganic triphosphatase YgiF